MALTTRVHISEPHDIACCRPSKWGNSYSWKDGTLATYKVASRKESLEKYLDHILDSPELLEQLPELEGKTLACFCGKDERCHVDILIDLMNRKVLF